MRIDVAPALSPLLKPARYKGAWGGRGSGKSHFFAEQLIAKAYGLPIRAVCIREVQNSIRDSVRQLLVDKIQKLDMGNRFEVLDSEIRGKSGSLITFKGMQSYNAENIKSLEDYDIAWVEEAQTLSQRSLDLLRPTLRADGSELWFSWNPRHRTDPVDVFFRKNPHPGAVSVLVNWRDNPWFPAELQKEMEFDFSVDPEKAEHVWEGAYGVDEGSIIARLVDRAERDGRIHDGVDADPDGAAIEISSDIGFRDTAAWWFWQRQNNGYSLVDYDEDSGLEAQEWIPRLQDRLDERKWKLGRIWLPHDARAKTFQSRHTVIAQFLEAFGAGKCRIVPRTSKTDRINAARTVIKTCAFAKTRCERGLDGLRAWIYAWDTDRQVFSREPEHNWASHPSDSFSYGCQVMQHAEAPAEDKPGPQWPHQQTAAEVFWPQETESPRKTWV